MAVELSACLLPSRLLVLLGVLVLSPVSVPQLDSALPRSSIAVKDLARLEKDVNAFFDAFLVDDRLKQLSSVEALEKAYVRLAQRAKVETPLAMLGDWELILQLSKPEVRELKGAPGKGFQRYTFADTEDGTNVVTLVSLPAGYGKPDKLFPVVIGLKPNLALQGEELEKAVRATCATAYAGVTENAIVLVPLGKETGKGRAAVLAEPVGSWLVLENLVTLLLGSLRLTVEQLAYDRSSVILDGWGDAGMDALELASAFPAVFAGVVSRSGPLTSESLPWSNLATVPILYLDGQEDGRGADAAGFAARSDLEVTLLEDRGLALAPSTETSAALAEWILSRHRSLAPTELSQAFASTSFNQCGWIRADDIARRATVKVGDPDYPRLEARADRASNTITVTTVNILGVRLFLSDALVDLDRPVSIIVNGTDRGSRVYPRSLAFMLENRFMNYSGDDGLYVAEVVVSEIDRNVPAGGDGG